MPVLLEMNMKFSSLIIVSAMALAVMSGGAFAKHKHPGEQPDPCSQVTHYSSFFTTTSRECLVDMLGVQYVRHMYGEGNHNHRDAPSKPPQ